MTALRIAFVTMPRLYADMLSTSFAAATEIKLVGRLRSRRQLAARLQSLAPDIIFIGRRCDDTDANVCQSLMACPQAILVVLGTDGREAGTYLLRPQRLALGDLSPNRMATAILDLRSTERWGEVPRS